MDKTDVFYIFIITIFCSSIVSTSRQGCPMIKIDPTECETVRVGRFCEVDEDCTEEKEICCDGPCGGTFCNVPEPRESCPVPNYRSDYCSTMFPARLCDSDNDCTGTGSGDICCEGDCGGSSCHMKEVPSICPAVNYDPVRCASVSNLIACTSSANCSAGYECCDMDCGGRECKRPCAECRIFCEYGFVMGDDGCNLCECYDPCKDFDCGPGFWCVPQEVQCITAPCYPVPYCEPAPMPTSASATTQGVLVIVLSAIAAELMKIDNTRL